MSNNNLVIAVTVHIRQGEVRDAAEIKTRGRDTAGQAIARPFDIGNKTVGPSDDHVAVPVIIQVADLDRDGGGDIKPVKVRCQPVAYTFRPDQVAAGLR